MCLWRWVVGGLVVGGLVGWWVGGLVGWWVGGLVGWWVGWLVGWLVGWCVGWLVGWLVMLFGCLVGWSFFNVCFSWFCLIHWLIVSLNVFLCGSFYSLFDVLWWVCFDHKFGSLTPEGQEQKLVWNHGVIQHAWWGMDNSFWNLSLCTTRAGEYVTWWWGWWEQRG